MRTLLFGAGGRARRARALTRAWCDEFNLRICRIASPASRELANDSCGSPPAGQPAELLQPFSSLSPKPVQHSPSALPERLCDSTSSPAFLRRRGSASPGPSHVFSDAAPLRSNIPRGFSSDCPPSFRPGRPAGAVCSCAARLRHTHAVCRCFWSGSLCCALAGSSRFPPSRRRAMF